MDYIGLGLKGARDEGVIIANEVCRIVLGQRDAELELIVSFIQLRERTVTFQDRTEMIGVAV